jgi:hypothetical protein
MELLLDFVAAAQLLSVDHPGGLRRQGVLVLDPIQAERPRLGERSYRLICLFSLIQGLFRPRFIFLKHLALAPPPPPLATLALIFYVNQTGRIPSPSRFFISLYL